MPAGNFQASAPFQRRHLQFAAQHRLPRLDLDFVNQVAALDREIRMPRQSHPQKQIAAFSAARPGLALTGQPNALPFVHAFRNFYLIRFDLVRIAPAQRNGPFRSMERFLERDHDVGFDVAAPLRPSRPLSKTAAAKTTLPASAAKKRLEEIAESGSAEFEFNAAISAAVTAESSARLLRAPSRWWLKSSRLIPVRAELVVLPPLLRIAQDFVSLVELFEFLLRRSPCPW